MQVIDGFDLIRLFQMCGHYKVLQGFYYVDKRVDLKFEIKTTLINCKTRALFSNYIKLFILNLAKCLNLFVLLKLFGLLKLSELWEYCFNVKC